VWLDCIVDESAEGKGVAANAGVPVGEIPEAYVEARDWAGVQLEVVRSSRRDEHVPRLWVRVL